MRPIIINLNYLIKASRVSRVWLGGRVVMDPDLRPTGRVFESPAVECNPGQVVCTNVPLSPSSIIWYRPMGGDARRLGR